MPQPIAFASLRLSLFYGALFLVVGLHLPYWPVWLEAQGLSAEAIGLLIGVSFWVKVVANPLVGSAVDRSGRRRRTMIGLAVGSLAGFSLFYVAEGFWALLGLSVVVGAFFPAMIPLGENLTLLIAYRNDLDYGRLRLWGSLSFIAASVALGDILTRADAQAILTAVVGALALTVVAVALLPEVARKSSGATIPPVSKLLRDRTFWVFVAATALTSASHMTYYGFATLHWRNAGIGVDVIGWLWAEGVMAEVVLFAFSGLAVARLGPTGLLLLAAAGAVVRWSITGLTTDPWLLFPTNALHALSFGAAHLGAMHFLTRAFPLDLSARAQTLYSSIVMGLVPGLAMLAAGALYARVAGLAFEFSALLGLAGLACALLLHLRHKQRALPAATDRALD